MIIHPENIPDEYKFTLNPIHPHCGPFNVIRSRANGPVDAICRMHDIAYRKQGPTSYIKFSEADKKFIIRMSKQKGLAPWAYRKVFELKEKIAPGYKYGGEQKNVSFSKNIQKMAATPRGRSRTPRRVASSSMVTPPKSGGIKRSRSRSSSRSLSRITKKSRTRSRSLSRYSSGSMGLTTTNSGGRKQEFDTGVIKGKDVLKTYYSGRSSRAMKYGITATRENTVTGVDAQCVYIGHATCSADLMIKYAAHALYKMVATKYGLEMFKGTDPIAGSSGTANQQLRFTWYVRSEVTGAVANLSQFTSIVGSTWNDAIANLESAINLLITDPNSFANNWYKVEVAQVFIEDGPTTVVKGVRSYDLTQAKITYEVVSSLKVQNQSVNSGDVDPQDEFNVNRIPLIGKKYFGKHGGTTVVGAEGQVKNFFASQDKALITVAAQTEPVFKEPPPKKMFTNVYKETGIEIEPGSIAVDQLKWKKTMKINWFFRGLNKIFQTSLTNYQMRFGKFMFYGLEAKIHDASFACTIKAEINQIHNVVVTARRVNETQPFVVVE